MTRRDPTDVRPPIPRHAQKPRRFPDDWVPDPVGANGSMGPPTGDERIWWRLQPGVRGQDGRMAPRSITHGGTCVDYPAGQHPPDWSFHTRSQVREFLSRPDEVIPCPKCSIGWISMVRG